MNQEITPSYTDKSFKYFLFKNKRNRIILWLAAIAIVLQFIIFKYLYPFANFIHGDSFSYIRAADQNLTINTYMIGYSKFLRLFSVFSKADYVLAAFQYLLIQSSVLFLLFTLYYFYKPGKILQAILLVFMVFNPLFLHLANLVSSDGFFMALSMIWFALLLWIIHQPSKRVIIWHAIILFIVFTVRYNALIYPFISAGAYWLSKLPIQRKLIGIAGGILLCGLFVVFTSIRYQKLTGYWQYSPFSGWQLANNAMYAYRYVDSSSRKPVPKKFEKLDRMIREFFDSTRDVKKFPSEKIMASTFYMWSPGMPLFKYRDDVAFKNDTTSSELKVWASMGPLYKSYGIYIIKKYPRYFLEYFVWPNALKYYAPPLEFLQAYNSDKTYIKEEAKNWFGYNTSKIKSRMKDRVVSVLSFYPILSGIINAVMLCAVICYLILKGWVFDRTFNRGILLASSIWVSNAFFTIFASSAALRFQSFPILLTTVFAGLLIDWLAAMTRSTTQNSTFKREEQKTEMSVGVSI